MRYLRVLLAALAAFLGASVLVVAQQGSATLSSGNFTGIITTLVTGLVTTSTDGLIIQNTTAATNAVPVQISPRIRLRGTAWDTAATKNVDWWVENLPFSAATPQATLKFGQQVEGGAAVYPATLTSAGNLTLSGYLVAGTLVRGNQMSTLAGGTTDGAAASVQRISKATSAITNATPVAVLTVTVPNAAQGAVVRVTLRGSLGAGGAIGANEATAAITYDIAVARTAGVATVATFSSAYGSATAAVAGAATITMTAAASGMTGAVSATQTFTINVTITRGSGTSDNHTCQVSAEVLNMNASGITLS